jgi:oligoendopeptidase F
VGLSAEYRRDPARFVPAFDDLLSRTGMADAATLAAEFGIDLRAPDFRRASLDFLCARIDQFVALAPIPRP